MSEIWVPVIGISLVIIGLILLILGLRKKAEEDKRCCLAYKSLFISGVIFLIFGIIAKEYYLIGIGAIFTVVGILYKNKWK